MGISYVGNAGVVILLLSGLTANLCVHENAKISLCLFLTIVICRFIVLLMFCCHWCSTGRPSTFYCKLLTVLKLFDSVYQYAILQYVIQSKIVEDFLETITSFLLVTANATLYGSQLGTLEVYQTEIKERQTFEDSAVRLRKYVYYTLILAKR